MLTSGLLGVSGPLWLTGARALALPAAAAAGRGLLRRIATGAGAAAAPAGAPASAAPAQAQPQAAAQARPAVTVTVNGRRVAVPPGSMILDATQAAGIAVPTLCKLPGRSTPGSCRVCMVDVNGVHKPACCTPAVEGSFISTDTPSVRDAVRGTLALLRANHPEDCMTCDANGRCEFQTLIAKYKVPMLPKLRGQSPDYRETLGHYTSHDVTSPAIAIDREKCIKCGRCVEVCQDVQKMNVLGWFARGRERHIGFMCDSDMAVSACISCGQCVSVCPVGALSEATHWRAVNELLESKRKVMVVQTAPATRVAIGEELGLAPGSVSTGQMVAGLKALGFDHVFDTDFSADLTIMEEGTELLARVKANAGNPARSIAAGAAHAAPPLPMFTSCCPGWINLVEQEYPEVIPHISSCKSPQQMLGAVIKSVWAPKAGIDPADVCVVSVMPCTAKKFEAARPEMGSDATGRHVDYVLTTRELGRMLRMNRIPATSLPPAEYDSPMGGGSGAAVLFGNSGGVTEAAVRTLYELVTGQPLPRLEFEAVRGLQGVKQATISLPLPAPAAPAGGASDAAASSAASANSSTPSGGSMELRIAVVNGIANARKLLEAFRAGSAPPLDFIEVMTCVGGCIGGGGQPKSRDPLVLTKRMQAVYSIDEAQAIRKSHENQEVAALYAESALGSPNSHAAHEMLHTHYTDRSGGRGGA